MTKKEQEKYFECYKEFQIKFPHLSHDLDEFESYWNNYPNDDTQETEADEIGFGDVFGKGIA